MKKQQQVQTIEVVIVSLTCAGKKLQEKIINNLRNAKKTFSEPYRANIMLGDLDAAIKNYLRPSTSTKEKRNQCDYINAICERIGKDIIRAGNEQEFKSSYAGKKMLSKLTANDIKFEFRTTTITVPVQPGNQAKQPATMAMATA